MARKKLPTIVAPRVEVYGEAKVWWIRLHFGVEDHRQFENIAAYNSKPEALRIAKRIAFKLGVEVEEA
jgi:hypothetical protein